MFWGPCGTWNQHRGGRERVDAEPVAAGVRHDERPAARSSRPSRGSIDWPAADGVRVSDAEREDAVEVLTQHYAEGRLDQAEFEQRALQAFTATTASDLRTTLGDLPPVTTRRAAVDAAEDERRAALGDLAGWLRFNALFVGIWLVTSIAARELLFFWPAFPLFFSGLGVVPSALRRLTTATRDGLQAART